MCRSELELTDDQVDVKDFSEIHSELIFYLEDKIANNVYTSDELEVYEKYKIFDELDVDSDECRRSIEEMEKFYVEGYK